MKFNNPFMIISLSIMIFLSPIFAKNTTKKNIKPLKIVVSHHKALPLLTLREVGRLNKYMRIRYVTQLRKAILLAAKIQKRFDRKSALFDPLKNDIWQNFLFGDSAYAASGYSAQVGEHCIYALNLIDRTKAGNGGCTKPSDYSCDPPGGKKGSGAKCGFFATGLPASVGCVNAGVNSAESVSTSCSKLVTDFKKKNASVINRKLKAYEQLLEKQIKANKYNTTEGAKARKAAIKEIEPYTYDERVFAHYMKLAADYLEVTGKIPSDLAGEGNYKAHDDTVKNFDKIVSSKSTFEDYDTAISKVDNIFFGYVSYCYSSTSDSYQSYLKKHSGDRRTEQVRKVQDPRATKTARDVSQRHECDLIVDKDNHTGRFYPVAEAYRRLKQNLEGIHSTLPCDFTAGRCPGQETEITEPAPSPIPPPTAEEPPVAKAPVIEVPEEKEPPITDQGSFGCERSLTFEGDIKRNDAMSCIACSAERDMIIYEQNNNNGDGAYTDSGISKKYLTLLNIMIRACGDAVNKNTNNQVLVDKALQYIETFGHCSNEIYSWNQDELTDSQKKATIKAFQTRNVEALKKGSKKNKTKYEAYMKNFKNIFGYDYNSLKKDVFCTSKNLNRKRFSEYKKGSNSLRSGSFFSSWGNSDSDDAREQNSTDLRLCLKEAQKNAEVLYNPNDTESCYNKSYYRPRTGHVSTERPIIGVTSSGTDCRTSFQLERLSQGKHSGQQRIHMDIARDASSYREKGLSDVDTTNRAGEKCQGANCGDMISFYENQCSQRPSHTTKQTPKRGRSKKGDSIF